MALLVAAGSGSRTGGTTPKQFRKLGGRSVIAHALDGLVNPRIDARYVVVASGQEHLLEGAIGDRPLPALVAGGAVRRISVRNGLERIAADGGAANILIHDAARPFLPATVIDRLLDALERAEGAVPVLPVADSLARSDGRLGETVPREDLVRVQTPQAFRFRSILAAHRSWDSLAEATDDAQVARAAGIAVAAVDGDVALEKLTYAADFERAERTLATAMISCTGMGFDVHAFTSGDHVWMAGLRLPHDRGLAGHSDADVALHALTDALLGACGAGDIGDHFPPTDPQWRGAASSLFLQHARKLIEDRGGRIDHVDVTIICEAPRIGPHKAAMKQNIASLLRLDQARVSVKATTTERLGFAGRGEGIAAQAVATVRFPEDI